MATSRVDPTKAAAAVVDVAATPPTVAVAISPQTLTIYQQGVAQFSAAVSGTNDQRVTWSADGGAIRQNGSWTAPSSTGTYHIAAMSVADSSKAASAVVNVVDSGITVSVVPNHLTEQWDQTWSFQAQVGGTSNTAVSWSIQSPSGANSIDQNGVFTPSPSSKGTFQVVATSRADPSKNGTSVVTVEGALKDGGAQVFPSSRVFVIWWGDQTAFAADTRPALEAMLQGLDSSRYLAIADQYMRGAKASVSFAGSFVDSSTTPDESQAIGEICRIVKQNNLGLRSGDVFIINSSAPGSTSDCAWHAASGTADTWCSGQPVVFGYIPKVSEQCSQGVRDLCVSNLSSNAVSVMESAAHELIEMMTDPYGNGWRTYDGTLASEAVDLCGMRQCIPLSNGSYTLPTYYSNATMWCEPR